MSAARFQVLDYNPNEHIGGGGCVCGDSKQSDCKGPYLVFSSVSTDARLSPHVVMSHACAVAAAKATSDAEDDPFAV